jgi:hypothetical protein
MRKRLKLSFAVNLSFKAAEKALLPQRLFKALADACMKTQRKFPLRRKESFTKDSAKDSATTQKIH